MAENHDSTFNAELSKLVTLLLDMELAFIDRERNVIATALSAEEFYGVVADANLLVAESGLSRTLKQKLLKVAQVYASVYEHQLKTQSGRFVEGAAASVAEYFGREKEELEKLQKEWKRG